MHIAAPYNQKKQNRNILNPVSVSIFSISYKIFFMKPVKKLFVAFAALSMLISQHSHSQGRLGYLAGTGIMCYNGDVNEKSDKLISKDKVFKPFLRAGINYRISSRCQVSASFLYGNVAGADSLASERDNLKRNQSFRSVIQELSFQVEYHVFSVYKWNKINPFVFAGAGLFHFNPQGQLDGTWYDLQPLGTEGQFLGEGNYPKPYKRIQVSIPIGGGVYFKLNNYWRLRLEYANHFTRTDYLDDVSTAYPDLTSLGNAPNGTLAVALSSRRHDGTPKQGRPRGNAQYNDSFSTIGITLIYNPGALRIGKPHKANQFSRMNKKMLHRNGLCRNSW